VAKRIIELDGHDFEKTMARASQIFSKNEVPASEQTKIGSNDFYRLESKMAFALYLQSKSLSYPKFVEVQSKTEENIFFSKQIDRRNFYLFGNKAKINQVIDLRVEDMVLNP
jgi:hypothetical protein